MNNRVLITGAAGLIGGALATRLEAQGLAVERLDLRGEQHERGDVCDLACVRRALGDCDGVVHLAAVSRVIWGEQDPEQCWATNVGGLRNVIEAAATSVHRPWVVFGSSREIYGQPTRLPAVEDTPAQPVNVYGRSKVAGEQLVEAARREGVRASIVRLSNVFGSTADHADRVVPAFARAAVEGAALRIDGAAHTFDFTHIDDVTRGLAALIDLLAAGEAPPPPIHFVSGTPTTLGELARLCIELAKSDSIVNHAPPRDFDVARFYGNPARAEALLGWRPRIDLREGLSRLLNGFARELGLDHVRGGGTP